MRVFPSSVLTAAARLVAWLCLSVLFVVSAISQTQATAADLSGTVTDPTGAVVAGATVRARYVATGFGRVATTDTDGNYQLIGLPPGEYEIAAEASTFKRTVISGVRLTVGQSADLTIKLEIGDTNVVVNVSGDDVQLVETARSTVSNTIDEIRIDNLPINERSATGFALTLSTVGRDNGRPIGPAPTSGLNIGGQRGRSTLVQVDGADFTDNSINAARSTVSQEAVQEYQVTTNSYMPEFGRATGGIVNVVTKRGTSDFRGNVFGFIRHKSIQARNPFAPIIDGDPERKPPFTRVQYGATLGGPLNTNDKTFFFGSFEQRRRQESGFFTGDIIQGATSTVTIPVIPGLNPFARTFTGLTSAQASYVNGLLGAGTPTTICTARAYAFFASSGTQTALNGFNALISPNDGSGCPAISPVGPGAAIGPRFILSGAPVPLTRDSNGQFLAFRPLAQLARIFPIAEATSYLSMRIDHAFDENNQLNLRLGFNPSRISGIQDESQNQTLGQNDYSRTGIQDLEDFSFGSSLTTILGGDKINEFYYNFGRRVAKFDSQVPSVAHQIAGTGFIGSNPFSPVNRTEKRHQLRDNFTITSGSHLIKFGGDFNFIDGNALFELNFPGLFNFSQQSASAFITGCDAPSVPLAQRCPAFTPVQAYGLGFPSVFIQGFGNPQSDIQNRPIAFFGQDTWKITRRLTINYGVRYDYEFTNQYAPSPFTDPLTGITLSAQDIQTAQDALNVTQGFPRDGNNIAPRVGFAFDLAGNGKTVIRGAIGRFFDHPLLAVAFNSDIADGSQQQQATLLPIGGPSPTGLLNAFQVFHGTVCGVNGSNPQICGTTRTLGVAPSANYLFGFQRFDPSRFTGFGPILPFTLHVSKDFEYPDATQANLAIERMIGRDMSVSASYIMVRAKHLAHPQDVNNVNHNNLIENFRRFAGRAPTNLTEAAFFSLPTSCAAPNVCPPGYTVVVPGLVGVNGLGQKIVSPIAADFFRRLGPNYFFVRALFGLDKPTFDSLLAGSTRAPGPINPYSDVNAQVSDGRSYYDALNLELKKRFSNNFQFLATYTWAHSIDDSSDLQTLLKPQDNTNFRAEKSDSLFDQRHRFVFSGVMSSPDGWRKAGGLRGFLSDFTFAPIVEFGSGRPFNIIAPGDANGDFQSTNERPFVLSDGSLCRGGNIVAGTNDPACVTGFPISGSLGRNMGITHSYFSVDARVSRRIRFSETMNLELIAEGFNLLNRFNEASGNPFYTAVNGFGQRAGNGRYYSRPTAAYDPRQFQFGAKFTF